MKYLGIVILFLMLINGCKKIEFKYPKQMMGEWTIVQSERAIIYADGTLDVFEDKENAGTLSVFEPNSPAETFKEFEI